MKLNRIIKPLFILLCSFYLINISAQIDTLYVPGDTVELYMKGAVASVQWQQSSDNETWVDVPGATFNPSRIATIVSAIDSNFFRAAVPDPSCPDTSWYSTVSVVRVVSSSSDIVVGNWFHGGIVISLYGGGSGDVVPGQDHGTHEWGCRYVSSKGAISYDDGQANTTAIVAFHDGLVDYYGNPTQCSASNDGTVAAKKCDTIIQDGYDDWFLPAYNQLSAINSIRNLVPNLKQSDYYWTSTEIASGDAHVFRWDNQSWTSGAMDMAEDYRCIRTYSSSDIPFVIFDSVVLATPPTPVSITSQPDSQNVCLSDTASVSFSVSATGTGEITYQWNKNGVPIPGAINNTLTINGLDVSDDGFYNCSVNNMCRTVESDSAKLNIIVITAEAGIGDSICTGSSTQLLANASSNYPLESGSFQYSWSPIDSLDNENIQDPIANPNSSINYIVKATDDLECESIDTVTIFVQNAYEDEQICVITLDSASLKNMIIWEKTPGNGTVGYKVYKEGSQINVYDSIGYVPYDSLTIWVDLTSIPEQQQYLYKISSVDSCGNESEKSLYHKPLFLQFVGGQLDWSEYEIEGGANIGFESYIIYRGSDSISLSPIATISSSLSVFNDTDPLAQTNVFYYRVAGVKTNPCDPAGLLKANNGPFSRSLSNLEDNRQQASVIEYQKFGKTINVFPNPIHDNAVISFSNTKNSMYTLHIYNISGELIKTQENISSSAFQLSRGNLESGIYLIELKGDKILKGKIVIE